MTLEQLKAALENNFGPPYLPEGHVRVKFSRHASEPTLSIAIGRRDIWLTEDGRVTAGGTICTEKPPCFEAEAPDDRASLREKEEGT